MIGTYLTDVIDIVSISSDENGAITKTIKQNVKARVEDKNFLLKDNSGKEVFASYIIFVDKKETIKYEDRIIIKKRCGVIYPLSGKEMTIKSLSIASSFSQSHYEVWA